MENNYKPYATREGCIKALHGHYRNMDCNECPYNDYETNIVGQEIGNCMEPLLSDAEYYLTKERSDA